MFFVRVSWQSAFFETYSKVVILIIKMRILLCFICCNDDIINVMWLFCLNTLHSVWKLTCKNCLGNLGKPLNIKTLFKNLNWMLSFKIPASKFVSDPLRLLSCIRFMKLKLSQFLFCVRVKLQQSEIMHHLYLYC